MAEKPEEKKIVDVVYEKKSYKVLGEEAKKKRSLNALKAREAKMKKYNEKLDKELMEFQSPKAPLAQNDVSESVGEEIVEPPPPPKVSTTPKTSAFNTISQTQAVPQTPSGGTFGVVKNIGADQNNDYLKDTFKRFENMMMKFMIEKEKTTNYNNEYDAFAGEDETYKKKINDIEKKIDKIYYMKKGKMQSKHSQEPPTINNISIPKEEKKSIDDITKMYFMNKKF